MARLRPRAVAKGDILPTVSFLIPAYNEQAVIEAKLANTLALDYPRELLEILVTSDEHRATPLTRSSPATPTAAWGCWSARAAARCRRSTGRYGRRRAIVCMGDANVMWDADSVRRIKYGPTPTRRWAWSPAGSS